MMRVADVYTTQKDIKHTTTLNDPFMNMGASFLTSSKGIQLGHACIQGPNKNHRDGSTPIIILGLFHLP
jgi:hypothetical protein